MSSMVSTTNGQRIAYVFPGQGSQAVGMGVDLFEHSSAARSVFEEADDALGFPLTRLCFEGPADVLQQTVNAQPAILTASVACLRAAVEANGQEIVAWPIYVAGHSLGEYSALVAADVVDFADAVRLVRERGRLMQAAGEAMPGGMAAIINLDEASMEEVCRETGAEIANLNSAGQIVISGTKEALARAVDLARARGAKRAIPLDVSAAFHSSLMAPAVEGMEKAIAEVDFREPRIAIVVNGTGTPVTTSKQVKEELLWQLTNCVQWQRSVEYMLREGVSTFVEIGPGKVLSGLIKRIGGDVQVVNVGDVSSLEMEALKK